MARKLASFETRDLFDLFTQEWTKPAPVAGHCFECGLPAAVTLPICGSMEPVCESCAAELAETMLAEAV